MAGAPPAAIADAQLVLSELVSNGIEHGAPLDDATITVAWSVDPDGVELCVADGGETAALEPSTPPTTSPRGRGLALVAALSRRWWVESNRPTRVCAVVAL